MDLREDIEVATFWQVGMVGAVSKGDKSKSVVGRSRQPASVNTGNGKTSGELGERSLFAQQLELLRQPDFDSLFSDQSKSWDAYQNNSVLATKLGLDYSGLSQRLRGETRLSQKDKVGLCRIYRLIDIGLDTRVFGFATIADFEEALEEKRYFRALEGAWLERIEVELGADAVPKPSSNGPPPPTFSDQAAAALVPAERAADTMFIRHLLQPTRDFTPVETPMPELYVHDKYTIAVSCRQERPFKALTAVLNPCLRLRLLPGQSGVLRPDLGYTHRLLGGEYCVTPPLGLHHLLVFIFRPEAKHVLLDMSKTYGLPATPADLAQLRSLVRNPGSDLTEIRRWRCQVRERNSTGPL